MKGFIDVFDVQYPDAQRQQCVASLQHRPGVHGTNGVNVGNLAVCVHSGIGSSGSIHGDFVIK